MAIQLGPRLVVRMHKLMLHSPCIPLMNSILYWLHIINHKNDENDEQTCYRLNIGVQGL